MQDKKRVLSKFDKFKLYFKTAPFLLGEVMILSGFMSVVYCVQHKEPRALFVLVLAVLGIFFVIKKLKNYVNGSKAIEYGDKSIANLIDIQNTIMTHNKRRVKDYIFEYIIDNKTYEYSFDSAYHRHLDIGLKLEIYYFPEDPNISVIPSLFGIQI